MTLGTQEPHEVLECDLCLSNYRPVAIPAEIAFAIECYPFRIGNTFCRPSKHDWLQKKFREEALESL
jgi:hypothetical protein